MRNRHSYANRSQGLLNIKKTMPEELKRFPTCWACGLLFLCLGFAVGLIPFLAFTIPPAARHDLPWWHNGVLLHLTEKQTQDVDRTMNWAAASGVSAVVVGPVSLPEVEELSAGPRELDDAFSVNLKHVLKAAHGKGMKVVVEVEPNFSGTDHPWFIKSRAAKAKDKWADVYVWREGTKNTTGAREPPNDWTATAGGPAWTWDEKRGQYYYHSGPSSQPEFNYRNPDVVKFLKNMLGAFMKRNVDGTLLKNVPKLVESLKRHRTEEKCECGVCPDPAGESYSVISHQAETLDIIAGWRDKLDKSNHPVMLATEATDCFSERYRQYYSQGVNLVVSPSIWENLPNPSGQCIWGRASKWLDNIPERQWPHWMSKDLMKAELPTCVNVMFGFLLSTLPGAVSFSPSHLEVLVEHMAAIKNLRNQPSFMFGNTKLLQADHAVLIFCRESEAKRFSRYLVAVNLNVSGVEKRDLVGTDVKLTERGRVIQITEPCHGKSVYHKGQTIPVKNSGISIGPGQVLVIQLL